MMQHNSAPAARGGTPSRLVRRASVVAAWVALAALSAVGATPALATPKSMSRAEIVAIAKTVPGFSYWWGGAKWKPGDFANKGKCIPNGSSGCPNCSHTGLWGADCSGFVGKAWQIDKPTALETYYHPYNTGSFKSSSTWWNHIARGAVKVADAFNYNTNGAGHIFLYEKGDPWGSVWAWECAGCTSGCKYGLRSASSTYEALQRKLLVDTTSCTAKCDGNVMVDAKCNKGDCAAYGSKCVKDDLGLRCVFAMCPNQGSATICLPDGKLATCADGKITSKACAAGSSCKASSSTKASCVAPTPTCPKSCDDGNGCTTDACDTSKGVCTHVANGASCDDGDPCTSGEVCEAGACKPGTQKNCDDGDLCTLGDGCQGGNCVAGAALNCDDGNACTVGEACVGGNCVAGSATACDDGQACTIDTCDAATGACSHVQDENGCDDGNPCTSDSCSGANCVHYPKPGPCGDGWVCHKMQCVDPATIAAPADAAGPGGADGGDTAGGASEPDTAESGHAGGADAKAADDTSKGTPADSASGVANDATGRIDDGGVPTNLAPAPSSGCSAGFGGGGGAGRAAFALWLLALVMLRWRRCSTATAR